MEQEAVVVPSPPSATGACHEAKSSRFLHSFGYHLAKRLVGNNPIDTCIRQAYDDLHLRQQQQSSLQNNVCATTSGEDNALFQAFRTNWRSNIRFPWHLPVSGGTGGVMKGGDDVNDEITNTLVQSLFIDVTFDFLICPTKFMVDENGCMMHSCHVLEKKDVREEADNSRNDEANSSSIAIYVAIRLGALLAIPTSQNNGRATSSIVNISDDDGRNNIRRSCENLMNDDGYRYYYNRGNTALTMADLNAFAKSIDIVLEDMNSVDVARIFGDAFIEGYRTENSWELMSKKQLVADDDTGTIMCANSKKPTIEADDRLTPKSEIEKEFDHLNFTMKLHHGVLQADGVLPLSRSISNGGAAENCPVQSIHRPMLDMILLQSKCSSCDGVCVVVPRPEALALWRTVDPSIISAVEAQSGELQRQKMNSVRDMTMNAAVTTSTTNDTDRDTARGSAKMMDASNSRNNNGKSSLSRPPQQPKGSALSARAKATTKSGSRKKPKFRLGPA
ncbi:hypothetical protein ACHAWU_007325 [Discostella pseudostelligera]|uniref:Uncharacterized protein n=1 Tax=Discostella pseudostelligera TaxID=259834 RepID=A0ABD3MVX2_9STRA